jgi:hypothetical protein
MSRKADREGLSLCYRIGYQIKVLGMNLYGPAQLGESEDPHRRLERQRAAKVAAVRQARQERQSGETSQAQVGQ